MIILTDFDRGNESDYSATIRLLTLYHVSEKKLAGITDAHFRLF